MALPTPVPGLVLHYSYLWHDEKQRGREEGAKDRPCLIVSVVHAVDGSIIVTVAPTTHRAPRSPSDAVELSAVTKHRLGMDNERSWIMVSDLNAFHWPGPDLRRIPARSVAAYAYGLIPPKLFAIVRAAIMESARNRQIRATKR